MPSPEQSIISELANDPDMVDLVEEFVGELPKRAAAVQGALDAQDLAQLQRLAHQLKGAAGGYGFQPISDIAAALEMSVRDAANLESIRDQVQELAGICQRARAK